MTERQTVAANARLTISVPQKLCLTWRLDPATGKPIARWTIEQASVELRAAA
jgi:hypothetical protein